MLRMMVWSNGCWVLKGGAELAKWIGWERWSNWENSMHKHQRCTLGPEAQCGSVWQRHRIGDRNQISKSLLDVLSWLVCFWGYKIRSRVNRGVDLKKAWLFLSHLEPARMRPWNEFVFMKWPQWVRCPVINLRPCAHGEYSSLSQPHIICSDSQSYH